MKKTYITLALLIIGLVWASFFGVRQAFYYGQRSVFMEASFRIEQPWGCLREHRDCRYVTNFGEPDRWVLSDYIPENANRYTIFLCTPNFFHAPTGEWAATDCDRVHP